MQPPRKVVEVDDEIVCVRCGKDATALHRGCSLCDDCCDCRPAGT